MLRLGVADIVGVLLMIVVFPFGEELVAASVAQRVEKLASCTFGRPVAHRIHLDADWQATERIVLFGARQHRPLIAQPPDVAEKHQHNQSSGADSNADLSAVRGHPEGSLTGRQETTRLPA